MAAPALPLTVRKGLRDAEAKIAPAIAEIEKEFGITGVTFECNWAEVYSKLPGDQKSNLPVIVESYLAKWVPNMKYYNVLNDPLNKQAIVKTWTTKKIVFRLNPEAKGYVHVLFENGVLVIQCKPGNFYCNVDDCGRHVPEGASTGSQFPLELERNFAEYETQHKENLAKIEKALGLTGITFEIVDPMAVAAVAAERGYENRLGEICFSWYLGGLASNVERLAADDMVKEAIAAAMPTKKILFRVNPSCPKSYHNELFENGALVIEAPPGGLCSNVDSTGADLEQLL